MTAENYRAKMRRRVMASAFERSQAVGEELGGARIYSARIESGIITHDTWLMIQAFPLSLRDEYTSLKVESMVLYPRKLAAASAAEYDGLVDRLATDQLPFDTTVDMNGMKIVRTVHLDDDYVSLKFPIGQLARQVGQFRKEAQQHSGKKSGQDIAWKLLANGMFGVLGSPYRDTHNIVAANLITAKVRAEAFAMMMALDGIQVVTDGCTFQTNQVPACTFAECLEMQSDYPFRRADAGSAVPFLDPNIIPRDDAEFTHWYREHVKRFFDVSNPEYDELFATHDLEHKKTGRNQSITFDGLACDGAANYIKCFRQRDGRWLPVDFKARSYGRQAKKTLAPWIIQAYAHDRLTELPPIAEDIELLNFEQAAQKALAALQEGAEAVYLPLAFPYSRVANYTVLKPAAFVFRTPKQRRTIVKQIEKFRQQTGCGLEVLTLRRGYQGRRTGSIQDLAEQLYDFIQQDGRDLTKLLNLNRPFVRLDRISYDRTADLSQHRKAAKADLVGEIDASNASWTTFPTGIVVTDNNLAWVQAASV